MGHSSDGSAGAVDLREPLCVTWTSHSLVAGFPGEQCRDECFQGLEAEVTEPLKGCAWNCDSVTPQ